MTNPGDSSSEPSANRRRLWSDLGPRLASAAVLIALTATALYLGGYVFSAVVGVSPGAWRREALDTPESET